MEYQESPGGFPRGREFSSQTQEESVALPQGEQAGLQPEGQVLFAGHESDTTPAEVTSSIADMIEVPQHDAEPATEHPAESSEPDHEVQKVSGARPANGIEVSSYLSAKEDTERGDAYRVAAAVGETGKSPEQIGELYKTSLHDLLAYGHRKASVQRKHENGQVAPQFAVMDAVHTLVKDHPELEDTGSLQMGDKRVSVNRARAVDDVLVVTVEHLDDKSELSSERWVASIQAGTLYSKTTRGRDGDEGYTVATTTERVMRDEDARHLDELTSQTAAQKDYGLAA